MAKMNSIDFKKPIRLYGNQNESVKYLGDHGGEFPHVIQSGKSVLFLQHVNDKGHDALGRRKVISNCYVPDKNSPDADRLNALEQKINLLVEKFLGN